MTIGVTNIVSVTGSLYLLCVVTLSLKVKVKFTKTKNKKKAKKRKKEKKNKTKGVSVYNLFLKNRYIFINIGIISIITDVLLEIIVIFLFVLIYYNLVKGCSYLLEEGVVLLFHT